MNLGNMNIPEDKMSNMLEIAGKKLGRDPKELQAELEAGKLDNVLSGLNPKTASQINNLVKNPEALNAMLNNDKIKNMLNGLMGGKK